MLGNITRTELPHQRAFEYLYYGSGHLQQTQWRDNEQLTVLAEYQRDRLHRETLRTSGALDNETGYDCRGRITHQVARQMNASQFVTPVIDRRYRWDKRNQLIERSVSYGQTGEVFTAGHWYYHSYQYDPLGQLTAHLGSVQTEHFLYDAAANLLTRPHTEAPHNQVQGSDKFDYRYDGFGRMVSRYEKGSSSGQRYHYDSDHRIIAVDIDPGPLGYQRAEYRYDLLGRRIEKRLWKASAIANTVTYHQHEPDEVYTFGWVGMRLVSEHSSAAPHTTVYHAYNDQSYTPLARIECTDNPLNPQRAIYYTHSSLSGLPEALTNSDGEIVWQGQYSAWGHLQRQTRPTSTFNREQNLRFQGQYFDKETGLHYNTFRYYAPDLGRFTQQDPIGLAGGINLYAYAPNPLTWVDPWGWAKEKTYEVVKYMSKNEVDAVRKANGGIVPHFNSNRVARWLNMPGADWNPKGEKFRIVFTINQKGMDMLNNHVDMDKLLLGETDLPRGVLSKPNEIGARGIGVGLLDEFNKQIKSARIETEIKTGKWKNIGVIKKC